MYSCSLLRVSTQGFCWCFSAEGGVCILDLDNLWANFTRGHSPCGIPLWLRLFPPPLKELTSHNTSSFGASLKKRALFDELAGDKHILLTEYIVGCFERAVVIFHNNKMLHPQLIRQKWGLSAAC